MKQLFYVLTVVAALPIHWTKAAESTTGVTEHVPLDLRAKTAKKPYNTARYWQLSVAPENEGDFINLFEKLMPVFQKEVELGQYHWWAMFKAHENELGANYLVSVGSDSIYINNSEPFQKLWRDNIITREEWVQTWSSILDIVKFQGSFVVSLNDYILNDVDEPRWPVDMKKILLTVGYITTAEENEMHMIKMIEDFWRERYQKRFELDGSLIGWNALKVEGNEKAFANANLITTMVQRTDRLPTELQLSEINSSEKNSDIHTHATGLLDLFENTGIAWMRFAGVSNKSKNIRFQLRLWGSKFEKHIKIYVDKCDYSFIQNLEGVPHNLGLESGDFSLDKINKKEKINIDISPDELNSFGILTLEDILGEELNNENQ